MTRMITAVLPQMHRQGRGRIINISSIIGIVPLPYVALYAASKHTVEGYSEALDHGLLTHGIRVTVIEPAYTRTDFENIASNLNLPLEEDAPVRSRLTDVVSQAMAKADKPKIVADAIVKAALSHQPKLALHGGKISWPTGFTAPARILDKAVQKSLQLDTLINRIREQSQWITERTAHLPLNAMESHRSLVFSKQRYLRRGHISCW